MEVNSTVTYVNGYVGHITCFTAVPSYKNVNLMSVCPCILEDMKRENQLHATQWFIETYDSLNMFRALLCPSSGARDYTDVHSMWHITLVVAGRRYDAWL